MGETEMKAWVWASAVTPASPSPAVLAGCTAPLQVPAACTTAMQEAEREATESDTALIATLDACETADAWIAALQAHPTAGALTEYSRDDAIESLDLFCVYRVDAPVCVDAAEAGMLTYELDDPRLAELQIPRE